MSVLRSSPIITAATTNSNPSSFCSHHDRERPQQQIDGDRHGDGNRTNYSNGLTWGRQPEPESS